MNNLKNAVISTASTFLCLILMISLQAQPTFTNVSAASGANHGAGKDGGAVWADFNNDGWLDILINTTANDVNNRTRLYQSDQDGTFTDVTATLAGGIDNVECERSAIWGDLNNDGNIDFIRNTWNRLELYINRGTSSDPDYMFGVGAGMTPNIVFTQMSVDGCSRGGGMNVEGMALLDYNNDGWLDIVMENGECGTDILENMQQNASATINTTFGDGTMNTVAEATTNGFFNQVTVTGNTLGLPLLSDNGDYMASGDYNVDGYVDFLVRKPTGTNDPPNSEFYWDLWENDGDGTFSPNTSFSNNAATNTTNGNKGGAIFCDFDKDGDLDIFWSDGGTNQIWLQDPVGTFTATSKPSIPGSPNIDGCACADIDNDGDIDMFLGNNTGNSYIYYNTTTTANSIADLSFTRTDLAVNADAEGVNLVDYDNDGDYDIYINVNGAGNQLWESDQCDGTCDYMTVLTEDCIDGSTVTRPIVGATLVLKDDLGNILSGAQPGSVASGHGAQNPGSVLFFLPDPNADYILDITFPEKNGTIESYSYSFNGQDIVNNTLTLTAVTGTNGSSCESFSVLPVELVSFVGNEQNNSIVLDWITSTEINNDRFEVEHSADGLQWDVIGVVSGVGNSNEIETYQFIDYKPVSGVNYYRLRQVDYDGAFEYHEVIFVFFESVNNDFEIFPNPVVETVNIQLGNQFRRTDFEVNIVGLNGQTVWSRSFSPTESDLRLYFNYLDEGIYLVELSNESFRSVKKMLVRK